MGRFAERMMEMADQVALETDATPFEREQIEAQLIEDPTSFARRFAEHLSSDDLELLGYDEESAEPKTDVET